MVTLKSRNLRGLNLSENSIARLTKEDVRRLVKLETLDLCNNWLTTLPLAKNGSLLNLKLLNISGNRIVSIRYV